VEHGNHWRLKTCPTRCWQRVTSSNNCLPNFGSFCSQQFDRWANHPAITAKAQRVRNSCCFGVHEHEAWNWYPCSVLRLEARIIFFQARKGPFRLERLSQLIGQFYSVDLNKHRLEMRTYHFKIFQTSSAISTSHLITSNKNASGVHAADESGGIFPWAANLLAFPGQHGTALPKRVAFCGQWVWCAVPL
jgi:hypothetical protein